METKQFELENFSGPLELLLLLVQKNEIEIFDVVLSTLVEQYKKMTNALDDLDFSSDFVASLAHLIFLKTARIAPFIPQESQEDENLAGADLKLALIEHLLEYSQFKESAKSLSAQEEAQLAYYYRRQESLIPQKPLGIEHLSLEEFSSLFKSLLSRIQNRPRRPADEIWKVSDKIAYLRMNIKKGPIAFFDLFSPECCRQELIVFFLALLELMKAGELSVIRYTDPKGSDQYMICDYNQKQTFATKWK